MCGNQKECSTRELGLRWHGGQRRSSCQNTSAVVRLSFLKPIFCWCVILLFCARKTQPNPRGARARGGGTRRVHFLPRREGRHVCLGDHMKWLPCGVDPGDCCIPGCPRQIDGPLSSNLKKSWGLLELHENLETQLSKWEGQACALRQPIEGLDCIFTKPYSWT